MNSVSAMRSVAIVFLLTSCTTIVGITELEFSLNSSVGKQFSEIKHGRENYWHLINESTSIKEYEYRRSNGCAFAVQVNKKTDTVESWRFTSPRSLCEQPIGAPGA